MSHFFFTLNRFRSVFLRFLNPQNYYFNFKCIRLRKAILSFGSKTLKSSLNPDLPGDLNLIQKTQQKKRTTTNSQPDHQHTTGQGTRPRLSSRGLDNITLFMMTTPFWGISSFVWCDDSGRIEGRVGTWSVMLQRDAREDSGLDDQGSEDSRKKESCVGKAANESRCRRKGRAKALG